MFRGGQNDVNYRCWQADNLHKANGGDWNWNTQMGFRRVAHLPSGEPTRTLEHPVAWPGYAGYPPDRDNATGTRPDYALSRHGGYFKEPKPEHPDMIISRSNRVAASDPNVYNQSMRARHPVY